MTTFDLAVVGAGPAGLTTAIFAADRGLTVCLVEIAAEVGGALTMNRGQMSGAGTRRQAERGIVDSPEAHYDDAMRISRGTSDPAFLAMAVRLQGPFIDWLMDHGFEMHEAVPKVIHGHEAYAVPRTYWGREDGRSILKVLEPMLDGHVAAGRIDLRLETAFDRLTIEDGRVSGIDAGGEPIPAKATVLATGGYGANPALFARLHDGATLWSGSYAHATGKGLEAGLEAGAALVHADTFLPNFGGILDHTVAPPRWRAPGGLTPQDRAPWEIVVNARGKRFYAEDHPSVDERAHLLLAQPEARGFVVYDQAIRAAAPSIFSYFPAAKGESFYGSQGSIVSAGSLDGLAARTGMDPAILAETVAAYNAGVAAGRDRFGRTHLPAPIAAPPFYALPIASYTVRGFAGLKVDTGFHVLDGADRPIPGLYAVGELLGSMLSGKGGVGGMSLSPALAFGRLLGETIRMAP